MSIVSGYLVRTILTTTLLVLGVLLALAALFEFIGELDDAEGGYGALQALLFAGLRLPQLAFEMLPIAALMGALLGLGGLASSSELVVMRTAGLSVMRLAGSVAIAGGILMVLMFLIGEFIGPPLDYFARTMRSETRLQQGGVRTGVAAWVKDGPVIINLERINSEFEFGGIHLFRFAEDGSLEAIGRAENSGIDADDRWVLENFRETRFDDDGVQVVESSREIERFELDSELLGVAMVKPVSLSGRGLISYISYLRKNNLSAERYESELWSRVASTVTVTVMPILALAFVFGPLRSSGAGGRLMVGVLIGLGYFLASRMLSTSGQVFDFNPALVIWVPTIALVMIAVLALRRVA